MNNFNIFQWTFHANLNRDVTQREIKKDKKRRADETQREEGNRGAYMFGDKTQQPGQSLWVTELWRAAMAWYLHVLGLTLPMASGAGAVLQNI